MPYRATSCSGRSSEFTVASPNSREASMMNSLYNASRSRIRHSTLARFDCRRWLIHVVQMDAEAPTNEPSAAASAVIIVAFIVTPILAVGADESLITSPGWSPQSLRCLPHQKRDRQADPHHHQAEKAQAPLEPGRDAFDLG